GRAQALQAIACGVDPHSDMNPVLLKPQVDRTSQLIVHGKVRGSLGSGNFRSARGQLLDAVLQSYARLRDDCDIVVVEGAGSPAEINLRAGDLANMGFARAANVPVILVGDIDRGGVIAAIVGTRTIIDPDDAAMIQGFLINKFRGDPALFEDGYRQIELLAGWRGFGVIPWLPMAARLPSEDAVVLEQSREGVGKRAIVACPILPRIANFDDLDPFKLEPSVEIVMVPPGHPIPSEAALIVLPGSKATIADLRALRSEGWDIDIRSHHRHGKPILGICGGYQMLGRVIADPEGLEGPPEEVEGLGLLDVETRLGSSKALRKVNGTALGEAFTGYEMHMGVTAGADCNRPFATLDDDRSDGAISADGSIYGTYIHGLFASTALRAAMLARLGLRSSQDDYAASVNQALDEIAEQLERHVDIDAMIRIATA
ncbi:MAG TPA: cobyric acid synthase, partial [Sphingobium sp.]